MLGLKSLAFGLALLSAVSVWADTENQWILKRDTAGIKIYQQPAPDGYALTRGEIAVNASPAAIITVMEDRTTCQRWVYACKQGHLIKQYNQTERLDYTVISSPLWLADRDMYLHSHSSYNKQTKTLTIRLSGRENHAKEQAGRVRIRAMYGLWQLQEKSVGITRIVYQIRGNPQLPASALLDAYMVESVFKTLQQLRSLSMITKPRPNPLLPSSGND